MISPRIFCAACAILLSLTSCIGYQSAERPRYPGRASEPLPPGGAEGSVAEHLSGERKEAARSIVLSEQSPARGSGALAAESDTWDRLRLLMTIVPVRSEISSLREFRRKLRRYHGYQQFFDSLGDNAQPWLHHVTQQLARRGMPGELSLLPAVESGYDAGAVSPRSAAGLWQILPGTARDLDLPRSRWYDARHDVPTATTAALDYLTFLREHFNDDWLLTVAAYNSGPGTVQRAIRRAGLKLDTADYPAIERYLPRETRGHVARWLVLSEIVATPRLHNVRMKTIPWRPYFVEISAKSQTDLAKVARLAGVAPAEISRLNRGLRRGMTAPNGPHRLLVPAEHADRIGRGLSREPPVRLAEQWRYRLRKGDTLSLIARRYNTTVKALMAANHLDSHLIRAGRELTIPTPEPRVALAESSSTKPDVHVVNSGESLWLIARQYRTTVNSLRDWNRIASGSNLLHPGQHLRIRGRKVGGTPAPSSSL